MKRPILILAVALLFAGPAVAEEPAPSTGRYQIAPDEDGFVRLDTETGALSHCSRQEGAWRCDILAEERSALERRVDALGEEVKSLAAELGRLTERLAALEGRSGSPAAAPPATASEDGREKELDEALTFAERLMRRFFDLVRELKREEPPQRI